MFTKLINEIKKHNKIVIHRHENPDGDALGSQFGMKKFIELNFKGKDVYAVGKDNADYLKSLFPKPTNVSKTIYKNALVIIIDTANTERISSDVLWDVASKTIKIDHHPPVDEFADINITDPTASSASEIVADIFFSRSTYKIDSEAASYIYTGMITDTNRFMFESITSKSLHLAAKIYDVGIKSYIKKLYSNLYTKQLEIIRYIGYLQQKYNVDDNVAYFAAPKGIEKKFNLKYSSISSQVNILLNSKKAQYAAYTTYDSEAKAWRTSLRSKKKAVNKICESFGGGGHKQACGIKLNSLKEFNEIVNELKKL